MDLIMVFKLNKLPNPPAPSSSNRQTTILRENLEKSIKENDELKHCAYKEWDSKKGSQNHHLQKIMKKSFFQTCGPFIYNKKQT